MGAPQMRIRGLGIAALAIAIVAPLDGRAPPPSWDGLVLVPSHRVGLVYLRPQTNFADYHKVVLDPPEIAYDKDWRRNYNLNSTDRFDRLTDTQIRRMIDDGTQMLIAAYSREFRENGYEIVAAPEPDAMRLFVGLGNVQITAPELHSPGARTFSKETGQATLVLEARDSLSGTLLGRAVDQRVIEDSIPMLRTDAGNRANFDAQFRDWASLSAKGLNDLKAARPLR